MPQTIPSKLIDHTLFLEGSSTPIGTGDVTLPSFDALTDTLSGGGILGEIDVPTPGHFGSLVLGINWQTVNREAFTLLPATIHGLEIRGAQQIFVNGLSKTQAVKAVVRGMGKSMDLGTFSKNAATGGTNNIELTYIKIFLDGVAALELDKFNYIFRINGEDQTMQDVRTALGYQ
ncbi:hypothetical protein AK95_14515 [Paenibacillus sp. LC231]|uniref:phage major tail tube protein n=1 Tax=Paenibacillus TaxID=44249 RepID=UPI0008DCC97D|nr:MULTISPECIES: phage major tail tube protein [Paenibacillus]MPY20642.1 phage tail protein [Paenibacillus glucanolyticus]OIB04827.1 hypothetical protein AK95_14515 [Paenibacillus sp. LC231]